MSNSVELLLKLQGVDYQLGELERSKDYLPDMITTLEAGIKQAQAELAIAVKRIAHPAPTFPVAVGIDAAQELAAPNGHPVWISFEQEGHSQTRRDFLRITLKVGQQTLGEANRVDFRPPVLPAHDQHSPRPGAQAMDRERPTTLRVAYNRLVRRVSKRTYRGKCRGQAD